MDRVVWVDCSSKIVKQAHKKRAKRKRLVWSEEMERRFVDSISKLGAFATPTTILEDMKFPGLTRGQVSSHLQQHRLKQKTEIAKTTNNKLSLKFLLD